MLNAKRPVAIQASSPWRSKGTPASWIWTTRATSQIPIAIHPTQRTT